MRLLMMTAFLALCMAPAVPAQNRITVEIPFAFAVGGQQCPAGVWTLTLDPMNPAILRIEKGDGKQRFLVGVTPMWAGAEVRASRLMFNQYGTERFLSEVWRSSTGSRLTPGAAEQRLIAQQAPVEKAALAFAGSK